MTLTPGERASRSRLGAYTLHAQRDPRETTSAARAAFAQRFLDAVDPLCKLPEEERLRRAGALRKAFYVRLALQSAQARRRIRFARNAR